MFELAHLIDTLALTALRTWLMEKWFLFAMSTLPASAAEKEMFPGIDAPFPVDIKWVVLVLLIVLFPRRHGRRHRRRHRVPRFHRPQEQ
jgi:hypothetical protein